MNVTPTPDPQQPASLPLVLPVSPLPVPQPPCPACPARPSGRRPYSKGLGLEAVGVNTDNRGRVIVDAHFR
mgnify:CR=1 FL=1